MSLNEEIVEFVKKLQKLPGEEHPCPYFPGKDLQAQEIGFCADALPPGVYTHLLNLNFRRAGSFFYRPQCRTCTQCRQIRLKASEFKPSRSQHRCREKNQDLAAEVNLSTGSADLERYELYKKYIKNRHPKGPNSSENFETFENFLYQSPVHTFEVQYRLDDKIVSVGIFDQEPDALSAVYCYFDPEYSDRSLGTYNMLWGIDHCRELNISWYYMGYYIKDCSKMNYKVKLRPNQILSPQFVWA